MNGSMHGSTRSQSNRGPAIYYGYCHQSRRFRMMDAGDFTSNLQEGMSRFMSDSSSVYQDAIRNYPGMPTTAHSRRSRDCGCDDCHCECCVCDTDVLVHARCGEIRRIPVTFENDTRRERPVKLELGNFVTAGGHDLGWPGTLSENEFTLRLCDEHTVTLSVRVVCQTAKGTAKKSNQTVATPNAQVAEIRGEGVGSVDRCEVGYATIRAEGCLTRPVVVAVAVLPDDCDAYRHPCGCGCCN